MQVDYLLVSTIKVDFMSIYLIVNIIFMNYLLIVSISSYEKHKIFKLYGFLENLSSLRYDISTNRLLASFRPQSNPTRHELYEITTTSHQSFQISLQLIQTFLGSSVNIILSRSKILHHNAETYVAASDNRAHGVSYSFDKKNLSEYRSYLD